LVAAAPEGGMNMPGHTSPASSPQTVPEPRGMSSRGISVRLLLTCWLVYMLHFSPFVARELYLSMSLAERHTVHVDPYVDLHPDLFTIPGRGSYLGGNPGASFLAAVPYWLALPVVNRVAPVRPPRPGEKISEESQEQRANRLAFYKKVRERGLDVHLGLAAAITAIFFMAPLSALSVVVMFRLLIRFGFAEKLALWLALLYAFGTPIFFRTGILSLNLLVALFGLFALAVVCRPANAGATGYAWRYFLCGFFAGWAVLTDFTGVIPVSLLGLFVLAQQMETKRFWAATKTSLWYLIGATGPVVALLVYQWYCFGNPWLPAQFHMPKAIYAGYPSEHGFGRPLPEAMWGLFFDPLYGLLVFAPIFTLALYHLALVRRRKNRIPFPVTVFSWVFLAALWLFCSCIHYTVRHQWQDGVRYIVPAVPFLFLLLADVLARMPRALAYLAAFAAVLETWALAMVREDPMTSLLRVAFKGLELPWLTALVKTAHQYMPWLSEGASPLMLFLAFGLLIWGIWTVRDPWRALDSGSSGS
jgi:hypothetical protein